MMLKTIKQDSYPINKGHHLRIAYMGTQSSGAILSELPSEFNISQNRSLDELKEFLNNQSILTLPDVIIIEADNNGECFKFIEQIKKNAARPTARCCGKKGLLSNGFGVL